MTSADSADPSLVGPVPRSKLSGTEREADPATQQLQQCSYQSQLYRFLYMYIMHSVSLTVSRLTFQRNTRFPGHPVTSIIFNHFQPLSAELSSLVALLRPRRALDSAAMPMDSLQRHGIETKISQALENLHGWEPGIQGRWDPFVDTLRLYII